MTLYLIEQDVDEVINTINQELETLYKWLTQDDPIRKKTTIIPMEKKANTNKAEAFRSIHMVSVYEKLLGVVGNNQFIEYFERNKLLSEYQAEFKKNNSCESALQSVLVHWKKALSENRSDFHRFS